MIHLINYRKFERCLLDLSQSPHCSHPSFWEIGAGVFGCLRGQLVLLRILNFFTFLCCLSSHIDNHNYTAFLKIYPEFIF